MDIRRELVRYYRLLRRHGHNDSHSGNASARNGDWVWITPAGACADTLQPDELVACRIGEPPAQGASSDAPLHLAVYRANPRAAALLHSHGPYSVAMTINGESLRPLDFEGQLYFPQVPVLDIAFDEYLAKAPAAVAATLAEHRIAIVRGHGVYAAAESLNLAYKWTCSLELSAQTAFIAGQVAAG